jgi:hypothetical protein
MKIKSIIFALALLALAGTLATGCKKEQFRAGTASKGTR